MKWVCGDSKYEIRVIDCNRPVFKKPTDIKTILSIISNVFGVGVSAMVSGKIKRGIREVTDARHTAMWFILKNTDLSKKSVGELFHRDHSCVIYAEHNITKLLVNKDYKTKYLECDQLIREYLSQR